MNRRAERGGAAVELAIFLPLLVFLATAAAFVVRLFLGYHALTDLSQTGARYATRAQLNPDAPGVYRFRPTAEEVVAYLEDVAGDQGLDLQGISVSPDPSTAFPDTPITVTVTAAIERGALGRAARGLTAAFPGFFGGGDVSPPVCAEDTFCLTTTATMREE